MKAIAVLAFYSVTNCGASAVSAVTIDMVTVGNPGNAVDTRNGESGIRFGSVGYIYRIGKYEVTAGQYTEFLNAVAKDDPNGLFNTRMGDPIGYLGANIQRSGVSPDYSYSVAPDWVNRPVNYVSFWDAVRFTNWLHNGQPTGPQDSATTEDGAYHNVGDQLLFGCNASARFFIPTEDEWYKAAYHNKMAGHSANYFDYPTGTNVMPGIDLNETTNPGNNANYALNAINNLNFNVPVIGSPYYRTEVGEFQLSRSPYGTFDQGGNVREWNETSAYLSDDVWFGSARVLRGGSFNDNVPGPLYASFYLNASTRSRAYPGEDSALVGFRVASVPEPNSAALCVVGAVMIVLCRFKPDLDPGEEQMG